MREPETARMRNACQSLHALAFAVLAVCLCAMRVHAQGSSAVVLDRVVAVVNNQAILQSDLNNEMRLSVLEPRVRARGTETPQAALQRLISRALIEQQIQQEALQATALDKKEIDSRLMELRRQLPACVHADCATDAGWQEFLKNHDLTEDEVEAYMRRRMEILHFIERRFRQGIQISQKEIESYYKDTLVPQYTRGETPPPLDQVAPRIEEILLQQQVNQLFSGWLENLRKQGEIEVLDPSLEQADNAPEGGAGSQ
jgi:peptidyl-prolyl cis-trans isomerase SurA